MHMDKPKITPRDFFLWAGAMIALYASVFSFISLLFSYIDYAYPDALAYSVDPYSSGMRFAIASLIVIFPLFLLLQRLIRANEEKDPTRRDIWIRRWALVFTIFAASATVATDLVTLINYFLGGDVTMRFLFKVIVVFLVAGGGLLHFLAELWGYWREHRNYVQMVGAGTAILVLVTIVSGFFIMGTPGEIRLQRFDDQKVSDLQNIQYQVINYWQSKQKLPENSHELVDPLSGYTLPKDPQSGQDYGYRITKAPYSFEVCADFNADSKTGSTDASVAQHYGADNTTWQHTAGQNCFERTIDPEKYPPFNTKAVPAVPTPLK